MKALIQPDKVKVGGKMDEDSRFIEPTIVVDVKATDRIMQEEVTGIVMRDLRTLVLLFVSSYLYSCSS